MDLDSFANANLKLNSYSNDNLNSNGILGGTTIGSSHIIQVLLADGSLRHVRVDAQTTVKRIIEVVLEGLGVDVFSFGHFALRLCASSSAYMDDCHWLHPQLRIAQLRSRYLNAASTRNSDGNNINTTQLKFELRIRFIANDIFEMYQTEMAAFLYLYEQLTADYVRHVAWKISAAKALEMAALMLRKRFPNLNSQNVEKKLDFGVVEKEGGLIKYLPEALIINTKRKHLQKSLVAGVRQVLSLTEVECVFRFMSLLADITPFHVEVFRAAIGPKWQYPVDVHVGSDVGIAYVSENTKAPIPLASLGNISEISVRCLETSAASKAVVKLRITGNPTHLTFTLPTVSIAESFAHLIDGYRTLLMTNCNATVDESAAQNSSAWRMEDEKSQLSPLIAKYSAPRSPTLALSRRNESKATVPMQCTVQRAKHSTNQERAAHCSARDALEGIRGRLNSTARINVRQLSASLDVLSQQSSDETFSNKAHGFHSSVCELDVDTRAICLEELLGEGQFGNVYKAAYRLSMHATVPVAVKVCKMTDDPQIAFYANKHLLDEARIMAEFRHPHIVRLIGAGADRAERRAPAVWLVMELASGGELRGYLQRKRACVDAPLGLITFAQQLASALAHMHERRIVHGDVAARNCLLANSHCLKLSDFGLSRQLRHENDVYTSPHGKLPIKWLPPESINQRQFSFMSDVYMFGVCAWEIFAWGVKPWQGVRNYDVIVRVERGERLRKPDACLEAIYALLMACWSADVAHRPRMNQAHLFIEEVLEQIRRQVPSDQIRMPILQRPPRRSAQQPLLDNNNNVGNNNNNNNKKTSLSDGSVKTKARRRSSSASAFGCTTSKSFICVDDSAATRANPTSTDESLRRALEKQRAECAADDRWLEEEEQRRMLTPIQQLSRRKSKEYGSKNDDRFLTNSGYSTINSEISSIDNNKNNKYFGGVESISDGRHSSSGNSVTSSLTSPSLPYRHNKKDESVPANFGEAHIYGGTNANGNEHEETREQAADKNALFHALVQLIRAITNFSKEYSTRMSNKQFLDNAREIYNLCASFAAESELHLQSLQGNERQRVALIQTLVKSDARKLKKVVEKIVDETCESDTYACDFHRGEALRFVHAMAVDGRSLLEATDAARRIQSPRQAVSEERRPAEVNFMK